MPLEAKDLATLLNRVTALEILTTILMRRILPEIQVGGDPVAHLEQVVTGPDIGGKLPEGVQEQLKNLFQLWKG